MGHRRDAPHMLYQCCRVFENTWIRELLGCLATLRFDGIKLNGPPHLYLRFFAQTQQKQTNLKKNGHRRWKMNCLRHWETKKILGKTKWFIINNCKSQSPPEEGYYVYLVELELHCVLGVSSSKSDVELKKNILSPVESIKGFNRWKASRICQSRVLSYIVRTTPDVMILYRNWYSCRIQVISHLRIINIFHP